MFNICTKWKICIPEKNRVYKISSHVFEKKREETDEKEKESKKEKVRWKLYNRV